MKTPASECKAVNKLTCPYHGAAYALEQAYATGNVSDFLAAKQKYDETFSKDLKKLEAKVKAERDAANSVLAGAPVVVTPSPLTVREGSTQVTGVYAEWDSYSEPFGQESDYGRNRRYIGLRIDETEPIDVRGVLVSHFNAYNEADIPDALVDYAKEIGVDQHYNYEIETSDGYYGEEYDVHLNRGISHKLNQWYYNHYEGANDAIGALNYVRTRGQKTLGMSPVEAVKTFLKNKKVTLKLDGYRSVSEEVKGMNSISIGRETAYDKKFSTPKKPPVKLGNMSPFHDYDGILLKKNDKYTLVDGFANVAGKTGRQRGRFLVLS